MVGALGVPLSMELTHLQGVLMIGHCSDMSRGASNSRLSWAKRTGWLTAIIRTGCALVGATLLILSGAALVLAENHDESAPGGADSPLSGQALFDRQALALKQELAGVYPFDLTGNGSKELVVVEVDRSLREKPMQVVVFANTDQAYGRLARTRRKLPAGLALAGVGQLAGGPALMLLSPGTLQIWPWTAEGFDPDRGQVIALKSMFVEPAGELKGGLEWIRDLSGDGLSELVVPLFDGALLLRQDEQGRFSRQVRLRGWPRGNILNYFRRKLLAYDLPALRYLDVDKRGWTDLVMYNDGMLQVFMLDDTLSGGERAPHLEHDLSPPEPFDPAQPWDPPLLLVTAEDLNGDGWFDLVFTKNTAADSQLNTKTNTLIFYGQAPDAGAVIRFQKTPQQVFYSEGFTLPILLDINQDKRVDLVMVNVEIGFWTAIKALIARSVSAEAAFYLMPEGGRYNQEPDELATYGVKFSIGRFTHQPISSFGDFNGDGHPDLLLSVNKESLGIHWGHHDAIWNSSHDVLVEDYIPIRARRMVVEDLNGDTRDDLVFVYNRNDVRLMPEVQNTLLVLLSHSSGNSPAVASQGQ